MESPDPHYRKLGQGGWSLAENTRAAGYYVAGIYREKVSGARVDRPELLRMIADLQSGEVVVAEKIDRISRLPSAEAEQLIASIRAPVRLLPPLLRIVRQYQAHYDPMGTHPVIILNEVLVGKPQFSVQRYGAGIVGICGQVYFSDPP
jgi:hypothetical protein